MSLRGNRLEPYEPIAPGEIVRNRPLIDRRYSGAAYVSPLCSLSPPQAGVGMPLILLLRPTEPKTSS